MPNVNLSDAEWQQVMNILIQSHPLLMKIASQLQAQTPNPTPPADEIKRHQGDGHDLPAQS